MSQRRELIDLKTGAVLSRTDFLRCLSAGAVLLLTGCGDSVDIAGSGSDSGDPTGGTPPPQGGLGVPGTPVSSADRASSIQAVEAQLRTLIGTGRRYDPAAMLEFLGKQKVFSALGYNELATCAWAVYTDGRILMIANDPPASPSAVAPAARRAAQTSGPSAAAGSPRVAPPAEAAGVARGLLENTRLLMDSPVGRDQRFAVLLDDVEVVLAQIASYGGSRDASDLPLIEQAIEQRGLLAQLRAAAPATYQVARAQGVL